MSGVVLTKSVLQNWKDVTSFSNIQTCWKLIKYIDPHPEWDAFDSFENNVISPSIKHDRPNKWICIVHLILLAMQTGLFISQYNRIMPSWFNKLKCLDMEANFPIFIMNIHWYALAPVITRLYTTYVFTVHSVQIENLYRWTLSLIGFPTLDNLHRYKFNNPVVRHIQHVNLNDQIFVILVTKTCFQCDQCQISSYYKDVLDTRLC